QNPSRRRRNHHVGHRTGNGCLATPVKCEIALTGNGKTSPDERMKRRLVDIATKAVALGSERQRAGGKRGGKQSVVGAGVACEIDRKAPLVRAGNGAKHSHWVLSGVIGEVRTAGKKGERVLAAVRVEDGRRAVGQLAALAQNGASAQAGADQEITNRSA